MSSFVYFNLSPPPQDHLQLRGDDIFNRSNRAILRCRHCQGVRLPTRSSSPLLHHGAQPPDTSPDHLLPNRLSGEMFSRLHRGEYYKTTTGLGCIPLSGISDHCSLTFVQFIRSTILSGSVNYYALSCCLSGDLTKWSVQWERALHVVQGSYLATWFICLVGKVVVGWPKMISRQRFEGMTTISPRKLLHL